MAAGQIEFAITMFKRAVEITRKTDGLFSTTQLPYLYPLIDAYMTADHTSDADREEQYLVNIAERNYPPQSAQFIASIERQAAWQERQGKFVTARHFYARAIEFTRRAGDVKDVRQVNQLRGLARCYRSEFLYGAADAEDISPQRTTASKWARPRWRKLKAERLDRGRRAAPAKCALTLLQNANGPAGTRLKRDTTIDLGDWNWIAGNAKERGTELRDSVGPDEQRGARGHRAGESAVAALSAVLRSATQRGQKSQGESRKTSKRQVRRDGISGQPARESRETSK